MVQILNQLLTHFCMTRSLKAMPSLRLWSLALLSAVSTAFNNTTGSQTAAHFREVLSPGTGVFLPSDSNYTTETIQRWDTFSEPSYVVSVKPALDTDVQKIVRCGLKPKSSLGPKHLGHNERCCENPLIQLDIRSAMPTKTISHSLGRGAVMATQRP
jgi:hypothetical protein